MLIAFGDEREIEEFFRGTTRCGRCALRPYGMNRGAGGRLGKKSVEISEVLLQLAEHAWIEARWGVIDGEAEKRFLLLELGFEDLTGAGDGIALVVEEVLDAEGHFDVAFAIEALAGAAFVGLELREFALPEAQDVGRHFAESGDFADAEVELVRNVGPGLVVGFADWLVLRHAMNSDTVLPTSDFGLSQYRPLNPT